MTADDLAVGVAVRVSTHRQVVGTNLDGWTGEVWGEYRRGEIPDWCLVKIEDGATIIVGFAPDELDPA